MGLVPIGNPESRSHKTTSTTIKMDSKLGLIQQSFNTRDSQWVCEALNELPNNFTITDPSILDHPFVFASLAFLKMSGYSPREVIGQKRKIFRGPKTNRRTVMEISEAIREERDIQVNLVNYRKDGTPFWMLFHMSPVFGKEDRRVIHFVAVQVPITRKQRRNGGVSLSEDGSGLNEIMFGSCRKEVNTNSVLELGRVLSLDSVLNGPDTDTSTLHQIKESIQTEQACTVRILSYRKDKSSFWNCLPLSPVRNASGKIAYFVGVQIEEEFKNKDRHGPNHEMRQLCTVGAGKVAVRSLSIAAGSSKS